MKTIIGNKIDLIGLTNQDVETIKNALTIPNPKYLEAVKFSRKPFGIDRTIKLYAQDESGLSIPRGVCLKTLGIILQKIEDRRHTHSAVIETSIETRDYQERAIQSAITAGGGVIVGPTGSGKTTIGIELAARLGQRCLILVKSRELAHQWQGAIEKFAGLDAGIIGGGKWIEGEQFTIATVQTLVKHEGSLDYGLLIVDECHNVPATQAYNVINRQAARYRFGLSATPQRRDGLEPMIFAALGPVVAEISKDDVEGAVLPVVVSTIHHDFTGIPKSWTDFLGKLAADKSRNQLIIRSALKSSQATGTAVLTSTIEHAERLAQMAIEQGAEPVLLHGQLPAKQKAAARAKAETSNLIIGTLSLLSEGIDWPHVGAVIFAAPVSAEVARKTPAATRLIQSIGRARRPYPGKRCAYILDIVDRCGFGISAARKRGVIYKQQGFEVRRNGN
ncbi:DEAD/DEAH box helicase [Methylomonas methanica]|uniref:Type III restriction protein res subunit n=1 Tax=Methylomonas methanica (strain DSM 25384 / MC09) TaxID=857087 RepID=G0A3T9_METMM|nr:DEAD/DEAH box helicase [Methylomonas methanica]AEG02711.1 type III restriction protein res subunit [Methylomonas methanica MC09]